MSPRAKNLAAFLVMCGIWGLTWLPTKVATVHIPPILLAGLRFTLAGAVYLAWSLSAGYPLATRRRGRLVLAVLLLTAGCHGPLFWGVQHAPSGLAAVVNFGLMPVFASLCATVAGEDRLDARRLAALALGGAGLCVLFWPRLGMGAGDASVAAGLAAVVAGTLGYAAGAVIARPLLRELHPVAFSAWMLGGGLATIGLSGAVEGVAPDLLDRVLNPQALLGLGFLVVFGSLTAFTIYLRLLRDWGPFGASLYGFVSPAIAVAVGIAALGEAFGPFEAAGMALMLGATAAALVPARG